MVRQELPNKRVVVSQPPRLAARVADELPILAVMVRIGKLVYISGDGVSWRVTGRYDELVTALKEAGDKTLAVLKGRTTPSNLPAGTVVVIPKVFTTTGPKSSGSGSGAVTPVKIATPQNPS